MAKRKQHKEQYEFHILPQGWKHILHEILEKYIEKIFTITTGKCCNSVKNPVK